MAPIVVFEGLPSTKYLGDAAQKTEVAEVAQTFERFCIVAIALGGDVRVPVKSRVIPQNDVHISCVIEGFDAANDKRDQTFLSPTAIYLRPRPFFPLSSHLATIPPEADPARSRCPVVPPRRCPP